MSLELANAITLSSYTDRAVTLPVDRAEYRELLSDLQTGKRTLKPAFERLSVTQ